MGLPAHNLASTCPLPAHVFTPRLNRVTIALLFEEGGGSALWGGFGIKDNTGHSGAFFNLHHCLSVQHTGIVYPSRICARSVSKISSMVSLLTPKNGRAGILMV